MSTLEAAANRNKTLARLLIAHDARLYPGAPDWVCDLIAVRNHVRATARLLIGLRRFRRSVLSGHDAGVVLMIARHVYDMRGSSV